ncbi:MAG: hypothetical protein QME32_04250, partial [Endomicrobiia bacterium]|nr:hypothetical protein [Endomicrobiia bacterium]
RFGFLFGGVFWGSILIFLGLSLIAKVIFHVNIPVFRIAFAFVLIYLGVQLLFCGRWCRFTPRSVGGDIVFSEGEMKYDASRREYSVVFGKGMLNLASGLSPSDVSKNSVEKEVNAVFGNCRVNINPAVPTKIKASAVFGAAVLPDGSSVSFGDRIFTTPSFKEGAPHLYIKVGAVFGSVEISDKN